MVRVLPAAVLAGFDSFHTSIEVIESDGEVAWVATGGFEPEPGHEEGTDAHQGQDLEANQRRLLCEFVNGGVTDREHRDAVLAVDRVVALGVGAKGGGVEVAASDDDDVIVREPIVWSEVTLLRHLPSLPSRSPGPHEWWWPW